MRDQPSWSLLRRRELASQFGGAHEVCGISELQAVQRFAVRQKFAGGRKSRVWAMLCCLAEL